MLKIKSWHIFLAILFFAAVASCQRLGFDQRHLLIAQIISLKKTFTVNNYIPLCEANAAATNFV